MLPGQLTSEVPWRGISPDRGQACLLLAIPMHHSQSALSFPSGPGNTAQGSRFPLLCVQERVSCSGSSPRLLFCAHLTMTTVQSCIMPHLLSRIGRSRERSLAAISCFPVQVYLPSRSGASAWTAAVGFEGGEDGRECCKATVNSHPGGLAAPS